MKEQQKTPESPHKEKLLGNFSWEADNLPGKEAVLASFANPSFLDLEERDRAHAIHSGLLKLIQGAPESSFLLPALVNFLEEITQLGVLSFPYTIRSFELWLNLLSGLSSEENYAVRAKIVGKWVDRELYQNFFPIGMSKVFPGSHFVCAHESPDIDTAVSSFWGWVDSFGASVSQGRHIWNLPGGVPGSQISMVFEEVFGTGVFSHVAKSRSSLTMAAIDLVTQKGFVTRRGGDLIKDLDHGRGELAIVLVDEEGSFVGDWRATDVEEVQQVVLGVQSLFRWFQRTFQTGIISLFAKENVDRGQVESFLTSLFDMSLGEAEPTLAASLGLKGLMESTFRKILGVESGLRISFRKIFEGLEGDWTMSFEMFQQSLEAFLHENLFNADGGLVEDRPRIFRGLEEIFRNLEMAIQTFRNHLDRLDVGIRIKHEVLENPSLHVALRSEVEEIRAKMGQKRYLTVTFVEKGGKRVPFGVVWASDVYKGTLGTVSLRDFCNKDEMEIAPYLEIISVVDHHKSSLQTVSAPSAIIGDAQSCCVLVAEQTFQIDDRCGLGSMDKDSVDAQIAEMEGDLSSPSEMRVVRRLLQKRMAAHKSGKNFISPKRMYGEYLSYLYAILDDTDLLSKVSDRDVECVASLLNRMKSLSFGKEVEIVSYDDIPRGPTFAKALAERILQNEDMYSLYKKIYDLKESEVEKGLLLGSEGHVSGVFSDTKEQNKCARVGQTKLFSNNMKTFSQVSLNLLTRWQQRAEEVYSENPKLDLHIHMLSTITGADEVYKGNVGGYSHRDQLWLWYPKEEKALDAFLFFLSAFQRLPAVQNNNMEVEFIGPRSGDFEGIFGAHWNEISRKSSGHLLGEASALVFHFDAGTLNSRKAMITPCLPKKTS